MSLSLFLLAFALLLEVNSSRANELYNFGLSSRNEWQSFTMWPFTGNIPSIDAKEPGDIVASALTLPSEKGQQVLFYATYNFSSSVTWIYQMNVNSFFMAYATAQPRPVQGSTLVNLCGLYGILFGGNVTRDESTAEVWLFDGRNLTWRQIHPNGKGIAPRSGHIAVVVRQPNSSCQCKESMLVYGGYSSGHAFSDLWELRCIEDGAHYEWIPVAESSGAKPKFRYNLAATSNVSESIMYLVSEDLWQYSFITNQWSILNSSVPTVLKTCAQSLAFILISSNPTIPLLYVACSSSSSPIGFQFNPNGWIHPLSAYDRHTNAVPPCEDALVNNRVAGAVVDGSAIVISGPTQYNLWNLTALEPDVWFWERFPQPKAFPDTLAYDGDEIFSYGMAKITQTNIGSDVVFYVFSGGPSQVAEQETSSDGSIAGELWMLNATTMTWFRMGCAGYPPQLFHHTLVGLPDGRIVVYGGYRLNDIYGDASDGLVVSDVTWVYLVRSNVWTSHSSGAGDSPGQRFLHSAVQLPSDSILVYGGINNLTPDPHVFSDLWKCTIVVVNDFNVSVVWTNLTPSVVPSPRYGHSAALLSVSSGPVMLIYGGAPPGSSGSKELPCLHDMWSYDVATKLFTNISMSNNRSLSPGRRCFHAAVTVGTKMLVTGGCKTASCQRFQKGLCTAYSCSQSEIEKVQDVWSFDVTCNRWMKLSESQLPFLTRRIADLAVWTNSTDREYVIALSVTPLYWGETMSASTEETELCVMKVGCPAGTNATEENFTLATCKYCPPGTYSSTGTTGPCSPCPAGFWSPTLGSHDARNCTECDDSVAYCVHGTCTVSANLLAKGIFEDARQCRCEWGYGTAGNGTCTLPTAIIFGAGAAGATFLVLLLVFVSIRLCRASRMKEASEQELMVKTKELEEIKDAWNINAREVVLKGRIDLDSPGGYGEVYKAEYREMTVAVKKLQHFQMDRRTVLEFQREIEVMRAIRHPNIVYFFGGGTFPDQSPFLVVEYVPRGSLTGVLRNATISLNPSQKVRFAMDAAKGMRFLHSLQPPRVHRDLKSTNLLVSDRWVVKVADFGSARLVCAEGARQVTEESGEGPLSDTSPLLQADYGLTVGVGTLLWNAPELLQGNAYGTPVDVYSFGIVLWEIWERTLPYRSRKFRSRFELIDAVLRGARPSTLSDSDVPGDYVALMVECWDHEPEKRSAFRQVVERLENIHDRVLISKDSSLIKFGH
eukprot:m.9577 g.9577  ORF g.9577 m.9577 type:complete len:1224 (+) comp21448_c0_seq1:590-4261(+)